MATSWSGEGFDRRWLRIVFPHSATLTEEEGRWAWQVLIFIFHFFIRQVDRFIDQEPTAITTRPIKPCRRRRRTTRQIHPIRLSTQLSTHTSTHTSLPMHQVIGLKQVIRTPHRRSLPPPQPPLPPPLRDRSRQLPRHELHKPFLLPPSAQPTKRRGGRVSKRRRAHEFVPEIGRRRGKIPVPTRSLLHQSWKGFGWGAGDEVYNLATLNHTTRKDGLERLPGSRRPVSCYRALSARGRYSRGREFLRRSFAAGRGSLHGRFLL